MAFHMYTDRKASSERIISGLCRPGKERSGAEVRPRAERQEEETASAKRNYDVKDPHTWKVPQLKSYLREYSLPSGEKRMKWRKGLCVTFRII